MVSIKKERKHLGREVLEKRSKEDTWAQSGSKWTEVSLLTIREYGEELKESDICWYSLQKTEERRRPGNRQVAVKTQAALCLHSPWLGRPLWVPGFSRKSPLRKFKQPCFVSAGCVLQWADFPYGSHHWASQWWKAQWRAAPNGAKRGKKHLAWPGKDRVRLCFIEHSVRGTDKNKFWERALFTTIQQKLSPNHHSQCCSSLLHNENITRMWTLELSTFTSFKGT